MEDVIKDITESITGLCNALNIQFDDTMIDFMSRMRNQDKKQRYKGLDRGELAKWKDWQNCYDGFFVENNYDIPFLFGEVEPLIKRFGYGI
jgi:hypothetical protein